MKQIEQSRLALCPMPDRAFFASGFLLEKLVDIRKIFRHGSENHASVYFNVIIPSYSLSNTRYDQAQMFRYPFSYADRLHCAWSLQGHP